MPTLEQLAAAHEEAWGPDTAAPTVWWTPDNPARGQCVPTVLVVQYFFGGDLEKLATHHDGQPETHYRNVLPGGHVEDLTVQQYPQGQPMTASSVDLRSFPSIREKRLSDLDTRRRYELLLGRVLRHLREDDDEPTPASRLLAAL
jgi:hypothetical protein